MKNTLKKITAAFASAVLCAVPMVSSVTANAAANADARFTFRETYYVDGTAGVKRIEHFFANRKYRTSSPFKTVIAKNADYSGGNSAGDTYYNCGGTLKKTSSLSGPVLSVSAYCNTATDFVPGEYNYCTGYKNYKPQNNEQPSYNSITTFGPFLVGDLNGNSIIDGADYSLLYTGINYCGARNADFKTNISVNGELIPAYKFDINDDGVITDADYEMHLQYISNNLQKFAK
ncbi:hypothetical protein [Ruminococcus flavefaciens]|uniref:hypothetical protein n=1 Tax=Ruminococcus flavefaciens TaxID=1265 RepID=UPI0002D912F4|nr:hypothetical protein [Ruminococcus flavefaciens]